MKFGNVKKGFAVKCIDIMSNDHGRFQIDPWKRRNDDRQTHFSLLYYQIIMLKMVDGHAVAYALTIAMSVIVHALHTLL